MGFVPIRWTLQSIPLQEEASVLPSNQAQLRARGTGLYWISKAKSINLVSVIHLSDDVPPAPRTNQTLCSVLRNFTFIKH